MPSVNSLSVMVPLRSASKRLKISNNRSYTISSLSAIQPMAYIVTLYVLLEEQERIHWLLNACKSSHSYDIIELSCDS